MQDVACRCGVIAFLFIAGCSSAVAQDARQQRSGNGKGNTEYRQPEAEQSWDWPITWQPKWAAVISRDDTSKAGVYQYKCEDPPTREDADACQQRRSAQATEDQYWIGFWAALASAAAAAFTGWAAWEAGKAATAAKDAAEVSQNALVNVQRAFILAEDAKLIKAAIDAGEVPQAYFVSVMWINKGTTWAKHCSQWTGITITPDDLPNTHDFFTASGENALAIPRAAVIGPGGNLRSSPIKIDAHLISILMSTNTKLYFYGWFEYDDVFDGTERHRTEFCFKFAPMHSIEADGRGTVEGHFQYHTGHNGADDDCMFPLRTGSPKNPLPNS
jgi:hypothetical protein